MREYIHKLPGDEGIDLPWAYSMIEEGRLINDGKEFIFVIGKAVAGSVCIGSGSLRFIHVPGYIVSWQKKPDNDLRPISIVNPVNIDEDQTQIKKILAEKYPMLQVCFL
jgi:hypothetical protein